MLHLHGCLSEVQLKSFLRFYHPRASFRNAKNLLNQYIVDHGDEFVFRKDKKKGMFAISKERSENEWILKVMDKSSDMFSWCLFFPNSETEFLDYSVSFAENPEIYCNEKILNDFRILVKHIVKKPSDAKKLYESCLYHLCDKEEEDIRKDFGGNLPIPASKQDDFTKMFFELKCNTRNPIYGGHTLREIQRIFGVPKEDYGAMFDDSDDAYVPR